MKKYIFLILFLLLTNVCVATASSIQFCENFNEQWQPINPGNEFRSLSIAWIATASKSYGIPRIIISIYKHDGGEEHLIKRDDIDVNPAWDTTGVRNMLLPSEGEFTIALTTPDGAAISSGKVKILKPEKPSRAKPQETVGTTLESIFKRYAPKK